MKIGLIQVKTHKLYIIKHRSNNKVSFVEFIFNSRQFKLMTTGSQPHGDRWPRYNCVQVIETMSSMSLQHVPGQLKLTAVWTESLLQSRRKRYRTARNRETNIFIHLPITWLQVVGWGDRQGGSAKGPAVVVSRC